MTKLCECGCGLPAPLATTTISKRGVVKGLPVHFINGHQNKRFQTIGVGPNPSGKCQCGCGQDTALARTSNHRNGNVSGRPIRFLRGHGKRANLAGRVFGRLQVIALHRHDRRNLFWECLCECGSTVILSSHSLLGAGGTRSCGCLRFDIETGLKHGQGRRGKRTPEFQTWLGIRLRCSDTDNRHYGGAGVQLCERWSSLETGFANFISDIGSKPTARHSLGRFLDTGNYEPTNCSWQTWAEQRAEAKGKKAMLAYRKARQKGFSWEAL